MRPISPRQLQVLRFIAAQAEMPSPRAIADHCGWKNASGSYDVIAALRRHGLVNWNANARGWSAQWAINDRGRAVAVAASQLEAATQ